MLVLAVLVSLVVLALGSLLVPRVWSGVSVWRSTTGRAARLRRDFGERAAEIARREAENPYNDEARTRFYRSVAARLERTSPRARRQ